MKISFPFPWHKAPRPPEKSTCDKQVLIFSDIDDTFVPWTVYNQAADVEKLDRTRQALHEFKDSTVTGLCSARGLSNIKPLARYFKGIPLAFIGTNGGQQVYLNSQQLPAEQWLNGLKVEDYDRGWQQEVAQRSGGFDGQVVRQATLGLLKELGFKRCAQPLPRPQQDREPYVAQIPGRPGEMAVVALTPDQTTLMFRADYRDLNQPLNDYHRAYARFLAKKLKQRLAHQGVKLDVKEFIDQSSHQIYLLEPRNISKESLVHHLLKRYPSVQAVITAGDNTNDTMLKPNRYGSVSNYRILSGNRPELVSMLEGKPQVEQTPVGELAPALRHHLEHILHPES